MSTHLRSSMYTDEFLLQVCYSQPEMVHCTNQGVTVSSTIVANIVDPDISSSLNC